MAVPSLFSSSAAAIYARLLPGRVCKLLSYLISVDYVHTQILLELYKHVGWVFLFLSLFYVVLIVVEIQGIGKNIKTSMF